MPSPTAQQEREQPAGERGGAGRSAPIYRKRPLERLSSPERLDQMLRVVRPPGWLLLLALAVGLALVLLWSVVGRVPVTARGTAILVRPKHVVAFQAPADGRIASLEVSVGDEVQAGALLALLDLPDLSKQLENERVRLSDFESRSAELDALERELTEKEVGFLADQRVILDQRIRTLTAAAEDARTRSAELIAQQRVNVQTARRLSEELGEVLESRYDILDALQADGLIPRDLVVDARSKSIDKELKLAELDVEEQALLLRENEARETYDKQQDLIADLRLQLMNLELREMTLQRTLRENQLTRNTERQSINSRIAQLEARLENEGRVVSEFAGRVLELTTIEGQHVELGVRLGKLEVQARGEDLMTLAYFDVSKGKMISSGQRILISPSTVQRERFGSLVGEVLEVSRFPVTVEAAANQIGDLEIARSLLAGEHRIEVLAALTADASNQTGFAWTSGQGPPDVQVTGGTTASVRVTIEERAPITFVLPFLRSLPGT